MIRLFTLQTNASENEWINQTGYDESNSFQITIMSDEKKVFTPDDFPKISCTDVYVASMNKYGNEYCYTLILVCQDTKNIQAEKEKLKNVSGISVANKNEYITERDTASIELSNSVIYLKTGQSKDVTIKNINTVNDEMVYYGISIKFDPDVFSDDQIHSNMFSKYGISQILNKKEAKDALIYFYDNTDCHFGIVNVENKDYIAEQYVKIINQLSQYEGIDALEICREPIPYALPPKETWSIEDESIASIIESGGEILPNSFGAMLNKTVTVTGQKSGTTSLKVYRHECGGITAECKIVVTENTLPGDVNGSGKYEAEDALYILKMIVKLEHINEYLGDADGNGEITAEDALLVLKKVVKLVE